MSGRPDTELVLERNVELERGPVKINADKATYRVVEDQVEASGNIRLQREGDIFTGDELRLKLDSGQGYLLNPSYRIERNNGQGTAERVDFLSRERAVIKDGTYSTCEATDPDWYLRSSELDLDTARDFGRSRNTVVFFKGLPIFGFPAMSFPLSDARQSGFLPPTFGTTTNGGIDLVTPYYFNIAPNRDLTLYPRVLTRRGLQMGAEGRYLGSNYRGETRLEYLANDQERKIDRYALSSVHTQGFKSGLSYSWNYNTASDDRYPEDFPSTLTTASQRLLTRDLGVSYAAKYWSTTALVSNYQVLQDPLSPITEPYDRLPQINFLAGRYDVKGFDWNLKSEITRFWHPDLVRGNRFVINPQLSYPVLRLGYFVTPKIALHSTHYSLQNLAPGSDRNSNRTLPIFSLDSGLIFERDTALFSRRMTQTLEPRLFYVYIPYRDQSALPNFDSAQASLNFAQLFTENRFIGNDRIGDANQVTAALTSRYLEADGAERLRLTIGQRFYFQEQRLNFGVPTSQTRSDLLLAAAGQITGTLRTDTTLQYSESTSKLSRASAAIRWEPAMRKVLSLQYRRDEVASPERLEQVDVAAQWPLANKWYGVGRVNYSLPDNKVAESLAGFEYKADCWVFRAVSQRIPTAAGRSATTLFLQLELTGLARLGSNPLEALRRNIPGYQPVN